jgi:hypothetical protein
MVFSGSGSAPLKILLLSDFSKGTSPGSVFSSLNCEHIALGGTDSVTDLGVPRNILAPSQPRRQALDALRHWFFRRRAGSGFLLTGFPASLSEAGILDAWLDESGETLDVCLFPPDASSSVATLRNHYSLQGLVWDFDVAAPLPDWIPTPAAR